MHFRPLFSDRAAIWEARPWNERFLSVEKWRFHCCDINRLCKESCEKNRHLTLGSKQLTLSLKDTYLSIHIKVDFFRALLHLYWKPKKTKGIELFKKYSNHLWTKATFIVSTPKMFSVTNSFKSKWDWSFLAATDLRSVQVEQNFGSSLIIFMFPGCLGSCRAFFKSQKR